MIDVSKLSFDASGLIPAIIQSDVDGQILMLGYMNSESIGLTISSGQCHFWSRSRAQLWHKGETSGNHLNVVSIEIDCDNDTLLIKVNPVGATCHKGSTSCFNKPEAG